MKKLVYVAKSTRINADEFDLEVTFSREEAIKAVRIDWEQHLTAYERKHTVNSIEGYMLDVKPGQMAEEAYGEYLDEGDYVDPVDYEVIK